MQLIPQLVAAQAAGDAPRRPLGGGDDDGDGRGEPNGVGGDGDGEQQPWRPGDSPDMKPLHAVVCCDMDHGDDG